MFNIVGSFYGTENELIVTAGIINNVIEFFGGKVAQIVDTHSVEDAVKACHDIATKGDTVLLSPCCASFDLFKSYEDRGRQFKQQVLNLKQ